MDAESRSAATDGTPLHYVTAGSGDPVLFLHGATLDHRMWDDQVAPFARHHRVVRCDLRGYGRSPRPTKRSPAPAEDVMALLAHLGSAPVHVVGHSLGGAVAVDLALAHPEAVRSLTLVGAGLAGFPWATFGASLAHVRSVARGHGLEEARRAWLQNPLFASAMERPPVAERLERMVAAYSGWHWLNDPPRGAPSIDRLEGVAAPTLVLVGARDLPDFQRVAETLHQRIPQASMVVMAEVGHMANMEDPERFDAIVLDFLRDPGWRRGANGPDPRPDTGGPRACAD